MLIVCLGCSTGEADKWARDQPEVVPAEGIVLFQGMPLEDATVVFSPVEGTHAASAVTDSAGRFILKSIRSKSGAVPGEYHVAIIKQQHGDEAPGVDETGAVIPPPMVSAIPEKYAHPKRSKLTAKVSETGSRDLKFDLK